MKKKILISTGGSGGHVIPAITFHDHLKEKFDVFLTTDKRGEIHTNILQTLTLAHTCCYIFSYLTLT